MQNEAFQSHAVWAMATEMGALIATATEIGDPAAAPSLAALRYTRSVLDGHRSTSEPAPYTSTGLTHIQTSLGPVLQELRNYTSNKNVGHITNAETHSDATMYHLGLLPAAALKGGAAAAANRAFTEYRDAATIAIESLQSANKSLHADAATAKIEWDSAISKLREQLNAMSTKITADETRLDTAVTTQSDSFTTAQTERAQSFNAWLESQGKALKALASDDLAAIGASRASASDAFSEIDRLRDDTKTVAGLAAGDQVARGYKRYSIRQWIAGLIAYALGLGAIAAGISMVLSTIEHIDPTKEIAWSFTSLKLGLTASAVYAAIVAFRLGSQLLGEAATAKQFELELKALGPLFPMDHEKEMLSHVKKGLVDRAFGRGGQTHEQSAQERDDHFFERFTEILSNLVNRIPKT